MGKGTEKKLMKLFSGQYVPRKLLHASSDICMGDDCSDCGSVCERYYKKGCDKCPLQKVFNRLGAYEETGLSPEQAKAAARLMGGGEEPRVSGEDLCRAVEKQKEFIRRYREKYREEPEFDNVILEIMLELEARRAAETGKTGTVKEEWHGDKKSKTENT